LKKSGIISVVGRTNAGKSTLVNKILGEKVSIVSPVAQTTRAVIRGVLTDGRGQLVLLDTPGLHKSRSLLTSTMNKRARAASEGTDAVLLVVDASVPPQLEDEGWMARLAKATVPVVLALNKTDKKDRGDEYVKAWEKTTTGQETRCTSTRLEPYRTSATTGAGVGELVEALFALLPEGEPLFDAETLSDYPRKLAIADIIREHFCLALKDEIPHSVGIAVESIRDAGGRTEVDATVMVKHQSHKGIVIGKGGKFIKDAQKYAAREIASAFGGAASVALRVKVEPGWDENPLILGQMGL